MASERARIWITSSPDETRALGEELGRALPAEAVVALDGELGSGKTCFVQGLASGLGVADPVTSPTYALLQTYQGRLSFHHFDAYMEGRERALLLDGGLEWMHAGGVAAIEWAGRVQDVLPLPRITVVLSHVDETHRKIEVSVEGEGRAADDLAAIVRSLSDPPAAARGAREATPSTGSN